MKRTALLLSEWNLRCCCPPGIKIPGRRYLGERRRRLALSVLEQERLWLLLLFWLLVAPLFAVLLLFAVSLAFWRPQDDLERRGKRGRLLVARPLLWWPLCVSLSLPLALALARLSISVLRILRLCCLFDQVLIEFNFSPASATCCNNKSQAQGCAPDTLGWLRLAYLGSSELLVSSAALV